MFLGPPQVWIDDAEAMDLRAEKVLALLAYLSVEANRPHRRSVLAAQLWPDQPEELGLQNLRKTLSRLRRAIDDRGADPPHLLVDRTTIQFNPQSDHWLDVAAFTSLIADTARHPHRRLDVCLTCESRLSRASDLYRGDFLANLYPSSGQALDEWLLMRRERFEQQACTALQALASLHLAHGQPALARGYMQRLLRLDPWNEVAQQLLLRALALSEGRNAALQHYEVFRRALGEELGVGPEDGTLALVAQIRAGTLLDLHSPILAAHLPTPATSFVGREVERRQVAEHLAGLEERLLTLYGLGGSGKTRLALEVAAEQAPLWQDGVWFVPLAEVPTPDGLVDALASALQIEGAGRSVEAQQLTDYLRSKELLLILDNYEHLLADTSLIRDILRHAPHVKLLVTSRSRLNIPEEWVVRIEGLPFPGRLRADAPDPLRAWTHDAVRLFAQHARRVNPSWTLGSENLPHVIHICQLVAGLPLGIELAAAWVRNLPCRRIAGEIARNLDFLRRSQPYGPSRQHSLRATFDHTYALLSEDERRLFRKLSVFRGRFSTEAAEQVAGARLSALAALADRSLLQVSKPGHWALHPLLQRYAAERLAAQPVAETLARDRHSAYYTAYLGEREAALWGRHPRGALAEIGVALANVRAAWDRAVAETDVQSLAQSIDALPRFYHLQGFFRQGDEAFGGAATHLLAQLGETNGAVETVQAVAARTLAEQAQFLTRLARYERAVQVARNAASLAHAVGDRYAEAAAYMAWGTALRQRGDYQAAITPLGEALRLAQAARSMPGAAELAFRIEAESLRTLGTVLWRQSDYTGAQDCLEQALDVDRRIGDRRGEGWTRNNLGLVAENVGHYGKAIAHYRQALDIFAESGDRWGESIALGNLGYIHARIGDYDRAQPYYRRDIQICREVGDRRGESWTTGYLSLLRHQQGHQGDALAYAQQALSPLSPVEHGRMYARALTFLGHALTGLERTTEAAAAYEEALAIRREQNAQPLAMETLAGLVRVMLAQGDTAQALAQAEEILDYLAGHSIERTDEQMRIYLTCYRALQANHDARAPQVLEAAYRLLWEEADRIDSEALRRSFLENVAVHSELAQAFKRMSDQE